VVAPDAGLIWLNLPPEDRGSLAHHRLPDVPMSRFAPKAIFALLTLGRAGRKRLDWDRTMLIFSICVTIGLVALYVYGKSTARW
jgi:hypothetical protein